MDKNGNKKVVDKIDEPTAHYAYRHNHIPAWILLKNVSFSNAINLFILLKPAQKEELVDMLITTHLTTDQKIQILQYTLTLVRKCRNTIAHNLKFISFDAQRYSGSLNHKSIKNSYQTIFCLGKISITMSESTIYTHIYVFLWLFSQIL